LSIVTLGYLRRYIAFCRELFSQEPSVSFSVNAEVATLFEKIAAVLEQFQPRLTTSFDDVQRRAMMDALGQAGSDYRQNYYARGFSGRITLLPVADLSAFLELAQRYVEHSLLSNRREDNLYHSYNILHLEGERASIDHLYEMLEGQVSILSSGLLSGDESLTLLESLRHSALYRADQHTYILYPDKTLPGFLQRNNLHPDQLRDLHLPAILADKGDRTLFVRDMNDVYHFCGNLHNGKDLRQALDVLGRQLEYTDLVREEGEKIAAFFETVFRHNEFTGRSGTFFAYEGLGSIYWHMISKLLLAVQETVLRCQDEPVVSHLLEKYRDIRSGLGFNKTPVAYGAFPTDPYSHTPKGQGARQPGMTGMVKEEILTRQAELGLTIENGCLVFNLLLIDRTELLAAPAEFTCMDVCGRSQNLELPPGSLAYSFCQLPVILQAGTRDEIRVDLTDGSVQNISGHRLDETNSGHIFLRDDAIKQLTITFVP